MQFLLPQKFDQILSNLNVSVLPGLEEQYTPESNSQIKGIKRWNDKWKHYNGVVTFKFPGWLVTGEPWPTLKHLQGCHKLEEGSLIHTDIAGIFLISSALLMRLYNLVTWQPLSPIWGEFAAPKRRWFSGFLLPLHLQSSKKQPKGTVLLMPCAWVLLN